MLAKLPDDEIETWLAAAGSAARIASIHSAPPRPDAVPPAAVIACRTAA